MKNHVVITGPESSGKSTLATYLAAARSGLYIPEYARGYLAAASRMAVQEDFDHLLAAQNNLLQAAAQQQARNPDKIRFILQDTGSEILWLWQQDKFNLSPAVETSLLQQRPDLYLLCRPDLPWEYDPLREDPHRRNLLFLRLREKLLDLKAPLVEVSGFGESRNKKALKALDRLLD